MTIWISLGLMCSSNEAPVCEWESFGTLQDVGMRRNMPRPGEALHVMCGNRTPQACTCESPQPAAASPGQQTFT